MAFVFVSHASADRAAAEPLIAALGATGIRLWVAPDSIPAGKNFDEAIVDALGECSQVLVVVSAAANASKHVHREVALADTLDKPLTPVLLDGARPSGPLTYYLNATQWVRYDERGVAVAAEISALLRTQTPARAPVAEPTAPPPPPAATPQSIAADWIARVTPTYREIEAIIRELEPRDREDSKLVDRLGRLLESAEPAPAAAAPAISDATWKSLLPILAQDVVCSWEVRWGAMGGGSAEFLAAGISLVGASHESPQWQNERYPVQHEVRRVDGVAAPVLARPGLCSFHYYLDRTTGVDREDTSGATILKPIVYAPQG